MTQVLGAMGYFSLSVWVRMSLVVLICELVRADYPRSIDS